MATPCRRGLGLASPNVRARNRGKNFERTVAKALGGFRPRGGNRGVSSSDIEGTPWSIEVTRTAKGAAAVRVKWGQAKRNATLEGREPVLVVATPRQRLADALVVCRFELFQQLTQEVLCPAPAPATESAPSVLDS